MVFSSVPFLFLFLPVVLLLYFLTPRRFRNALLLAVSLVFYMWGEAWFVLIMVGSSGLDFICGGLIEREFRRAGVPFEQRSRIRRNRVQKAALLASLIGNLGALGFFKYFNFGLDNLNALLGLLGLNGVGWEWTARITLPLGISFYTFQTMSYTLDVYRGHVSGTRNLIDFACFVTMFPQLIAGPIVRYIQIERELKDRSVTTDGFARGVEIFIVGLGKKVLIANVLAEPADRIFALAPETLPVAVAWLGAIYFTFQLFFDFAGYSDMARGMGLMFGFKFPENFNYPFICTSMSEFWQRWHMTLSFWLRDYLFVPLGGYRLGRVRGYINLLIVFFLCGLWHGASWNFIVFGLICGVFIVFERVIHASRRWLFKSRWVHVLYTVPILLPTMVMFRSGTCGYAIRYYRVMLGFGPGETGANNIWLFFNLMIATVLVAAVLGSIPFVPWLRSRVANLAAGSAILNGVRACCRLAALSGILLLCAMALASGTYNPFIYFRF